jgi:RES domain-containing protein
MKDLKFLWRISNHRDLSGLGGERSAGRWHTAAEGKRVVYLAEHPAVALIETLANLRGDPSFFPDSFQLLKIEVPEKVSVTDANPRAPRQNLTTTQTYGNAWLAGRTSALLRVPSAPSPESWNYVFNPLHPDASAVKVVWAKRIAYDKRLFHLSR